MFSYHSYGLNVLSNVRLPKLLPANKDSCDVRIHVKPVVCRPDESDDEPEEHIGTKESALFFVERVGRFEICGGREIIVTPEPNVSDLILGLWIVQVAILPILYQRGLLALHASALNIGGSSILFLGPSGFGKSSLAAGLHRYGHELMADDITAVDPRKFQVLPGYPEVKLFPGMVASLGYDMESLQALPFELQRRCYRNTHEFQTMPLPLRAIYVLSGDGAQGIESLRPQDTLLELIRNSHGILSLQGLIDIPSHFMQCSQLAKTVPSYRLNWHPSPSTVLPVLRMLEDHFAHSLP